MGVRGLWRALSHRGLLEDLTGATAAGHAQLAEELEGKVAAVDASVWIFEAMAARPDLDATQLVHAVVNTAIARVSSMVRYGMTPVLVFDGPTPAAKTNTVLQRKGVESKGVPARSFARTSASAVALQRLFNALGLSWVDAPGEAEAMCGAMCASGLVDCAVTADGDVLAYGAGMVIRSLDLHPCEPCDTRASLFRLPRLCQALGLPESEGPDAAVALAVLCGNDFDKKGGKGVGPEEAFRALGALARSRGEQRDGGVLTGLTSLLRAGPSPDAPATACTGCRKCGHDARPAGFKGRIQQHQRARPCAQCGTDRGCLDRSDPSHPANASRNAKDADASEATCECDFCVDPDRPILHRVVARVWGQTSQSRAGKGKEKGGEAAEMVPRGVSEELLGSSPGPGKGKPVREESRQESDTVEIVASSVAGQRVAMGGAEMPDFMFARKGSGAGPSQAPAVTAKDGAGAAGDHGSSARAPAAPSAPPACVETLLAAAEAFLAERRAARAAVERLASRSLGWVRAPNLSALSDAFPFHLSDSKLLRKAVPILVEYTLRSRAFARDPSALPGAPAAARPQPWPAVSRAAIFPSAIGRPRMPLRWRPRNDQAGGAGGDGAGGPADGRVAATAGEGSQPGSSATRQADVGASQRQIDAFLRPVFASHHATPAPAGASTSAVAPEAGRGSGAGDTPAPFAFQCVMRVDFAKGVAGAGGVDVAELHKNAGKGGATKGRGSKGGAAASPREGGHSDGKFAGGAGSNDGADVGKGDAGDKGGSSTVVPLQEYLTLHQARDLCVVRGRLLAAACPDLWAAWEEGQRRKAGGARGRAGGRAGRGKGRGAGRARGAGRGEVMGDIQRVLARAPNGSGGGGAATAAASAREEQGAGSARVLPAKKADSEVVIIISSDSEGGEA